MYVKGLFEVYKTLQRIGIKPKDIIGMGGDIVKMGKSLFNTRINPKLITFIEKNQKIPTKILENIKLHARTLKNVTENQKNLFLENIKSIQKAKFPKVPKPPVTGVKQPATSDTGIEIIKKLSKKLEMKNQKGIKSIPTAEAAESQAGSIGARVQQVKGWNQSQMDKFIKSEKQLSKILDDWDYGSAMTKQSLKKPPAKVIEKVTEDVFINQPFKGWTPKVIKGGKDKLATGGRAGFDNGGIELYPRASVRVTGETPNGLNVTERETDYGITGLYEADNWFGGAEIGKGNVKVDVTQEGDTLFKDTMGKDEVINFIAGFGDPNDEKFQVKVDDDFENVSIVLVKSFATGGIANHFRTR